MMPGQQFPPGLGDLFSFDKLAHTGVFAALVFLMIIGFSKQSRFRKLSQKPVKYSLLISLTYASILELGQAFISDRHANFYDMAFNLFGMSLGYFIFFIIYKLSFN